MRLCDKEHSNDDSEIPILEIPIVFQDESLPLSYGKYFSDISICLYTGCPIIRESPVSCR